MTTSQNIQNVIFNLKNSNNIQNVVEENGIITYTWCAEFMHNYSSTRSEIKSFFDVSFSLDSILKSNFKELAEKKFKPCEWINNQATQLTGELLHYNCI